LWQILPKRFDADQSFSAASLKQLFIGQNSVFFKNKELFVVKGPQMGLIGFYSQVWKYTVMSQSQTDTAAN
jgi:hypothetical protein